MVVNRLKQRLIGALCSAGVGVLVLAGCGGAAAQDEITNYVGEVAGTDAFIGIAVYGDEVMAYVCDGETIAEWFRGTLNGDGIVSLTSASGGQLTATLGNTTSGSYTPAGGQALSFAAEPAEGEAGLYRLVAFDWEREVGGWVVLNNGDLRGAKVRGSTVSGQDTLDSRAGRIDSGADWVDPDPK